MCVGVFVSSQLLIRLKTWLKVFRSFLLLVFAIIRNFAVLLVGTYVRVCLRVHGLSFAYAQLCICSTVTATEYAFFLLSFLSSYASSQSHLHRAIYSTFFSHFSANDTHTKCREQKSEEYQAKPAHRGKW